ncbi:MAG: RNA 3'-terminal phosphate cyclase [Acidobacteria bacterium]|nr:RNA 3'-terminal phosphate cyclase [Acidobacteriota bacterium]MCK6683987.1 RNA 3'-terminal phosphate cyclase [Thermoanaerobaculia bacterium]
MIVIDGSTGEGGGQILRTALSLSLVTGQPFRIEKIRARRAKPGLMRQHLTAVEAASKISSARVDGGRLGSTELTFDPADVASGEYEFSIGTAGSTTLVFQTVLPALLRAQGESRLVLKGGTHNPLAPPFDFLEKTFAPLLARMGASVELELVRPGFYPAGGGELRARIAPPRTWQSLSHLERGEITHRRARALVAALPEHVGRRELAVVREKLGWPEEATRLERIPASTGPGNVLLVEVGTEASCEVFAGFGEKGVTAESIAEETVRDVRDYLASPVPVGEYLADQLLVPLAIGAGGEFRTLPLSRHARTNIEVLGLFGFKVSVEEGGGSAVVRLNA